MTADAFELTMQDPPRTGERLVDFADLVGETILAAFDNTENGEFVLVTENRNWIVLDADDDGFGDSAPYLKVIHEPYHRPDKQVLSDFVRPRELLNAGVINAAVYQELQAKADEAAEVERQRKANRLRAELAKLEGGAA